MQTHLESPSQRVIDPDAQEVLARLMAERAQPKRAQRQLPGWARVALRVLPKVLLFVSLSNLFIGALAIVAPLLRVGLGTAATNWIYSAYSLICPQRPSHTTFLAGEPMAMEQRMVAMYVAFGIAGLLYLWWPALRRVLPTWAMLLGVAPALVDVALSSAGVRPSTADSRLWTGTLASAAIVWWAYPRFDAKLRAVRTRSSPPLM